MRALSLHRKQLSFSHDVETPVPETDEVLVKVLQAGVCETDLQLAQGYMGFSGVLGHEFVGIAQSGPLHGQRVVGEINCNCRSCPRCNTGLGNHCARRSVVGIDRHDGAFADFVAVPNQNLHLVPETVSDDEAVFVEPLAAAFEILEQVKINRDNAVAICGDGRLALMSAKAIALTGATVVVIGKHDSKLNRFRGMGIETIFLDQSPEDRLFDVVVDCTGSTSGLELALSLVRPRGTIVLKTTVASEHKISLAKVVIDEISLVGSRCGPFDKAIAALRRQDVDVKGLITHRFPIESAIDAMQVATSPDAFKVMIEL